MGYFNYHAKVKRKINNGELISFVFFDKWKDISPALVLYFSDGTKYPIREHKFDEYIALIKKSDK